MAADAATLSVMLRSRGLDSTTRDMRNMRREIGSTGGSAKSSALNFKAMALQITAVAAVTATVGAVGMKLINAASAAEEMRNKFDASRHIVAQPATHLSPEIFLLSGISRPKVHRSVS